MLINWTKLSEIQDNNCRIYELHRYRLNWSSSIDKYKIDRQSCFLLCATVMQVSTSKQHSLPFTKMTIENNFAKVNGN